MSSKDPSPPVSVWTPWPSTARVAGHTIDEAMLATMLDRDNQRRNRPVPGLDFQQTVTTTSGSIDAILSTNQRIYVPPWAGGCSLVIPMHVRLTVTNTQGQVDAGRVYFSASIAGYASGTASIWLAFDRKYFNDDGTWYMALPAGADAHPADGSGVWYLKRVGLLIPASIAGTEQIVTYTCTYAGGKNATVDFDNATALKRKGWYYAESIARAPND